MKSLPHNGAVVPFLSDCRRRLNKRSAYFLNAQLAPANKGTPALIKLPPPAHTDAKKLEDLAKHLGVDISRGRPGVINSLKHHSTLPKALKLQRQFQWLVVTRCRPPVSIEESSTKVIAFAQEAIDTAEKLVGVASSPKMFIQMAMRSPHGLLRARPPTELAEIAALAAHETNKQEWIDYAKEVRRLHDEAESTRRAPKPAQKKAKELKLMLRATLPRRRTHDQRQEEAKKRAKELVANGKSGHNIAAIIARESEVHPSTVRRWLKKSEHDQ